MSFWRQLVTPSTAASASAAAKRSWLHTSAPVCMAEAKNRKDPLKNVEQSVAEDPNVMETEEAMKRVSHHNKMAVLSGAPEKHMRRRVTISHPARVATQQGRGTKTKMWQLTFDKIEVADRWTNPLMGWTSTGDPLSNMSVRFSTKEAAIKYAERNGFAFRLVEPEPEVEHVRKFQPYGRSMVHQWQHTQIPVYDDDVNV